MLYDMESGYRVFFLLILCVLVLAGCCRVPLRRLRPAPSSANRLRSSHHQPCGTGATIADMALQAADLPSDYILRDRS